MDLLMVAYHVEAFRIQLIRKDVKTFRRMGDSIMYIICKKLTRFSVCVRMSQFPSQINFVRPHYFCLSPLHFVPPTQFCPSPLHSVRPHYIMSVLTTSVHPHIPVLFFPSLSCVISGHGYPSLF